MDNKKHTQEPQQQQQLYKVREESQAVVNLN